MAKSNPVISGPDRDWQAESDMMTLVKAQEIKKDKPRYARAKKFAQTKLREMEGVFGEEPGDKK